MAKACPSPGLAKCYYYYYLKHVTTFVQVKNLLLWNITVLMAKKCATISLVFLVLINKRPNKCWAQKAGSRRVQCSLIAMYLEHIIAFPPWILAWKLSADTCISPSFLLGPAYPLGPQPQLVILIIHLYIVCHWILGCRGTDENSRKHGKHAWGS
jgi:hypothetical protein